MSSRATRSSDAGNQPRFRILMVTGSWLDPPLTGALLRSQAMIRYLGARHDLTFMSFKAPDQGRDESLRWCKAVRPVNYGGPPFAGADKLPYLVRRRASEKMREAISSL